MCHYLESGPDYEGGETLEEWNASQAEIEMALQAEAEEREKEVAPWDINPKDYEPLP